MKTLYNSSSRFSADKMLRTRTYEIRDDSPPVGIAYAAPIPHFVLPTLYTERLVVSEIEHSLSDTLLTVQAPYLDWDEM